MATKLHGVYAAVVTPFDSSGQVSVAQLDIELDYLKSQGCTGILIGGSTGEAQSLSVEERIGLAQRASQAWSTSRLLIGTGAASIEDSVRLTKAAFDLNVGGVVVIPPFFFKNAPLDGLVEFYGTLLARAVPEDGQVLLYNNPVLTHTEISFDLIRILRDRFPRQVVGIKDSSSNLENTLALCTTFVDFQVLVGDDRLVLESLRGGAAGAITGITGIYPTLLIELYDKYQDAELDDQLQERITATHRKFDGLPRIAAFKEILVAGKVLESATVRPPLQGLTSAELELLRTRFNFGQTLAQIGFKIPAENIDRPDV